MSGPEHRVLVITYCCREKNPSPDLLPAGDRYLSPRIRAAGEAASGLGFDFRILSGLYGLLEAGEMIPDYDHLLTAGQVPDHAARLQAQLEDLNVGRVVFVTRSLEEDPAAEPYRQAMARACGQVQVDMEILEIGPGVPAVADLVSRMWGPGRYRQPH